MGIEQQCALHCWENCYVHIIHYFPHSPHPWPLTTYYMNMIIIPPSSRDLLRDPEPSGHSSTERDRIPDEALPGRL